MTYKIDIFKKVKNKNQFIQIEKLILSCQTELSGFSLPFAARASIILVAPPRVSSL